MITLNIFKTLYNEFIEIIKDIKYFFTDLFSNIHQFLNKFMSDDIITLFGIAIIAFIAICIFRYVINKR